MAFPFGHWKKKEVWTLKYCGQILHCSDAPSFAVELGPSQTASHPIPSVGPRPPRGWKGTRASGGRGGAVTAQRDPMVEPFLLLPEPSVLWDLWKPVEDQFPSSEVYLDVVTRSL